MIGVLDLGIGNLSSVQSGLERAGSESLVLQRGASYQENVRRAKLKGLLLPGVGAFGDAMFSLKASGLYPLLREAIRDNMPVLGICLGMQMLLSMSEEHGNHIGLGYIGGRVVRFKTTEKVPHMGWNSLTEVREHPLLQGVKPLDYVYFVHSYYACLDDDSDLLAKTDYGGVSVPAVIGRKNVYGTQFHPEKSGSVGEQILANFVQICEGFDVGKEED